jgi:hypothetical protein
MKKMSEAEEIIYEVLSGIENDFDNKLTIHDIYQKLAKIQKPIPTDVLVSWELEKEGRQ